MYAWIHTSGLLWWVFFSTPLTCFQVYSLNLLQAELLTFIKNTETYKANSHKLSFNPNSWFNHFFIFHGDKFSYWNDRQTRGFSYKMWNPSQDNPYPLTPAPNTHTESRQNDFEESLFHHWLRDGGKSEAGKLNHLWHWMKATNIKSQAVRGGNYKLPAGEGTTNHPLPGWQPASCITYYCTWNKHCSFSIVSIVPWLK